jgi:hypothetical protein
VDKLVVYIETQRVSVLLEHHVEGPGVGSCFWRPYWHGSIQDPDWRRIVRAIDSSLVNRASIRSEGSLPPDEPTEASRRSVPVEAVKPRRNNVSVPALLATVILLVMFVGVVAFVLRSVLSAPPF